ncbi:protein kinase domain-containing protein [Nesterenkonia sp. PF2B19]|uniref:protein kinase domain-containing protein n=1 Tax=Nesterenkonia sp. PF2B19 TaxID=1881858 RepID=UPI003FA5E6BB
MADVYLGHDLSLNRQVAVKMLRPDLARDPQFQGRFRREAQSSASLNHHNIVGVYDTGRADVEDSHHAEVKTPYIVMEYVDGVTLRHIMHGTPSHEAAATSTTRPPPSCSLRPRTARWPTGPARRSIRTQMSWPWVTRAAPRRRSMARRPTSGSRCVGRSMRRWADPCRSLRPPSIWTASWGL